jgi:hypothetical protein
MTFSRCELIEISPVVSSDFLFGEQGCQIFQTYQNGKNIPNDHKPYQKAIKYTKWPKIFQKVIKYKSILYSKAFQMLPKLGFLV